MHRKEMRENYAEFSKLSRQGFIKYLKLGLLEANFLNFDYL